jgi:hypothetical protein
MGGDALKTDLYCADAHFLIGAKADATRASIRYAIGQLFDYVRCFNDAPLLAVM